uniref:Polymerase nucleotidyl transferase domain-containing protein n=1 Tax=viral metagenome TaxID=1070528 RepID=A0A6C0H5I1_9ZZZZ
MEITRNKLTREQEHFFYRLRNYLETPIYFYGSIQRSDYVIGKSDIDVDIFTENEESMKIKLANFLKKDFTKFKEIIWRLKNNKVVSGYKIMYHDKLNDFNVEISIYNEKHKKYVLKEHNHKFKLNIIALFILYILKTIYYKLSLINQPIYAYLKKKILSFGSNTEDDDFIVIKM